MNEIRKAGGGSDGIEVRASHGDNSEVLKRMFDSSAGVFTETDGEKTDFKQKGRELFENSGFVNGFKRTELEHETDKYVDNETDTDLSLSIAENESVDKMNEKKMRKKRLSRRKKKIQEISTSLLNCDVELLKAAAIENRGLISDDIRRKVWPKLAGVDVYETSPRPSIEEIEAHPYYKQVILDVNRSLKRFPPSIEEKQRLAMQDQLVLLIMRILLKNTELHYYQGYHDICVTFLLVLGEEISFSVVNQLSTTHLRIFMDKTMERTTELLSYIYPVIGKRKPNLRNFLEKSDVGVMFCLSWLITWFGHVLNKYSDVVRLFDLFLASHSWMPMYLSAAIVLHREAEIFKQDCDMACVHSLLSHVPDDLPFESLITDACSLYEEYPPEILEREESPAREMKRKNKHFRQNRCRGIVYSVIRSIQNAVPTPKLTVTIVIAAAVLVYAVVYEAYRT